MGIIKIFKRIKSSDFIGTQLSRFKMGQSYYAVIVSTINAVSLVTIAFAFEIWVLMLLFPSLLIGVFFIGYYMDKRNIFAKDVIKGNEMSYKFLLTSDYKLQDFNMVMTRAMLEVFTKISKNEPVDIDAFIKERYDEYVKRWEPKR